MKSSGQLVCLLIGSNIEPEENLPRAIAHLRKQFPVHGVSTAWESPAVGSPGPNFLNAAVLLNTKLNPEQLKQQVLRPLENQLGRVRGEDKFAPRTIDIDVVVWGDQAINPDIERYAHAALPVAELLPHLHIDNTGESLDHVARRLKSFSPIRPRPEVTIA